MLQPYRDLVRLTRKEVVLAENASWLFRVAPYAIFASTWVAAALVPTFSTGLMFNWAVDLIAIVALLGTARFFLGLAAMDVGTAFGGIGASREAMIASLAEPAMLMIAFTVALLAGTSRLSGIAEYLAHGNVGLRVSLALSLIALVMVAIAENARIPIDNPATHLELTMIHEAMLLEYSARHLALIEWAAALKLFNYSCIGLALFFPFGIAAGDGDWPAFALAVPILVAKLAAGGFALALIETLSAKMRIFRAPEFLGTAFLLAVLAMLVHLLLGS